MIPIILASSSPRRQDILKKMNIPFRIIPSNIDESYPDTMPTDQVSEYLAIQKVKAVVNQFSLNEGIPPVLGADTTVILENKIYGKPKDINEAISFITSLQGKTHTVITSMALYINSTTPIITRVSKNFVTFSQMNENEINWFINTGEWHGVAGAYRIQGSAANFINKIEGSESSVIGLPISDLYDMLKQQGFSLVD